jgi:tetratricopeptide (TPR) repeat protein
VSLLLEALKKAEAAKQQGAAGLAGSPGAEPGAGEPASAAAPLELAPERPLITRDRLPDITQPLEILSEDLPSASAPKREKASVPPGAEPPAPSNPRAAAPDASERRASTVSSGAEQDRTAARQIFEAKTPDYNPRRPFYYLVGVIGVFAIGIAGYFAYQLFAPRPSFYTGPTGGKAAPPPPPPVAAATPEPANPAAPASAPSAAPEPPAASASETAPTSAASPAAAAAPAVPVPPQPAAAAPARRAAASTRPAAAPAAAAATDTPRSASAPTPATPPARPAVRVTPAGPRIDPNVERGWTALQAGDLAQAREAYTQALRANPRDRDALLGLAAIDTRTQDFESAEARYNRVLELDPRDAYAQASLLSLRGQADPVQTESRLKNLVAQQPDATVLNFSLGNQYAAQRRWAEAQQAYFAAMAGDPDNPDYAYNLAVSLDHLRQPKLALEYYLRALSLAGNRQVGFNPAQVEARVREIQRR